ncbi:DNA polymerase III subunit alpha [Candidatus Saccharibacteria bacterium]|nr:DNA polymerase III subunit alpha [Candidatus Saccharibacteria bacterium]MCB9821611.1 DNA polymerase III subunit alpha [Candidatus Nomurabacteria bacterium]
MAGKLSSSDFVHLHNHTHHSLLDGLQKIPEMVEHAKNLGMDAIAKTDHGTLSGTIEFYKAAKDVGIKPIIGMETYVASRKHTDRDPQLDKGRYHLILLAQDNVGYENLMRLSTIANLQGTYYKPRIDHDLLEQYGQGLVVLSGCMGGEVSEFILADQVDKAEEVASWYKQTFPGRYYIELQDHSHTQPKQAELNKKLIQLADKLDIPVVVSADAHYLKEEDAEVHEILLCVQTSSFLSDTDRMSLSGWHLFVSDPKDVIERWQHRPDAISNTRKIADSCNVDIELGKILIPKFPTPGKDDEKSYLQRLVYQGLCVNYANLTKQEASKLDVESAKKLLEKQVLERAEYELAVIDSMGFNGYFLIVWDFIKWGKEQGIVFGPGRGSAAGSIVAYALKITTVEPLRYDLLFERFLNPDRISMPDIDIDIQDSRRDEVIKYVTEKYGADRVANIVTFGRMAARNAVRDVARVLQVPYADADRMAKLIPPPVQGRHIPLKKSLEDNSDLKTEYGSSPQSKRVFDLAVRLEGTIRSHGVHAAGVVIAPDELVKFAPLEMAQKGVVATQYPMGPVEELGLLKMDFLGLSNLTIIRNAQRIIRKVYGQEIDIDTIPLDDQATFELLQNADTTGVFQLESSGMKQYLKRLKPTTFEDIAAMTALYRPGPLGAGLTDAFINRKNGKEEVKVPHPAFEAALSSTYGTLVYQEQVMQISREVCGFTGGESDTLRKAIGKKIREVMQKMEKRFVEGGIEHSGVPKEVMQKFWDDLMGFADYAFNKSHSVCYGLIAYQTAYLKAHYPDAFMAALMTSDADNLDRLGIEIAECSQHGIKVLPPDINSSYHEFAIIGGQNEIRFGMDAVKNVGHGAVAEIIRARDEAGPFADVNDFVARVNSSIVNRKSWESLIKAGAFDALGSRTDLLASLDDIIHVAHRLQKEAASGQTDLFGALDANDKAAVASQISVTLSQGPEISKSEVLAWERELLGLYLSEHPLEDYRAYLEENTIPSQEIRPQDDGRGAVIGGVIQDVRTITTKNGQMMAFVKIEDFSGDIEVIVFPNTYKETSDNWQVDKIVEVKGKVSGTDQIGNLQETAKIMASSIKEISHDKALEYRPKGKKLSLTKKTNSKKTTTSKSTPQTRDDSTRRLFIRLDSTNNADQLTAIKLLIDKYPGKTEVVLVIGKDTQKQILRLPQMIEPAEPLLEALGESVGKTNVRFG